MGSSNSTLLFNSKKRWGGCAIHDAGEHDLIVHESTCACTVKKCKDDGINAGPRSEVSTGGMDRCGD